MILREKLDYINWRGKYKLYKTSFEYVDYLKKVEEPKFSVIIISWRLHHDTLKNLKTLYSQKKSSPFEVIFVDNGGNLQEFAPLTPYIDTYIRLNQNTGAYLARNVGAVFAQAPYLIFLEDDGIPDHDFIKAYHQLVRSYDVISIRGVYLAKTDNPLNARQNVYYWGSQHFPSYVNLEGNALFLAEIFYQAGGWDDQIRYGHGGMELSVRLLKLEPDKRRQIYSPLPIIYHDLVKDEQQFVEKRRTHELAYLYLKEKHPNIENFIRDWQAVFLSDFDLETKEDYQLKTLQQNIYERNQVAIEYMNELFVPSYDLKRVKSLVSSLMMAKQQLYIFGAGSLGEHILNTLNKVEITVSGFLDNNSSKWGYKVNSYPVLKPDHITDNDLIIIASIYSYEIKNQLEKMNLKNNRDFIIMQ